MSMMVHRYTGVEYVEPNTDLEDDFLSYFFLKYTNELEGGPGYNDVWQVSGDGFVFMELCEETMREALGRFASEHDLTLGDREEIRGFIHAMFPTNDYSTFQISL